MAYQRIAAPAAANAMHPACFRQCFCLCCLHCVLRLRLLHTHTQTHRATQAASCPTTSHMGRYESPGFIQLQSADEVRLFAAGVGGGCERQYSVGLLRHSTPTCWRCQAAAASPVHTLQCLFNSSINTLAHCSSAAVPLAHSLHRDSSADCRLLSAPLTHARVCLPHVPPCCSQQASVLASLPAAAAATNISLSATPQPLSAVDFPPVGNLAMALLGSSAGGASINNAFGAAAAGTLSYAQQRQLGDFGGPWSGGGLGSAVGGTPSGLPDLKMHHPVHQQHHMGSSRLGNNLASYNSTSNGQHAAMVMQQQGQQHMSNLGSSALSLGAKLFPGGGGMMHPHHAAHGGGGNGGDACVGGMPGSDGGPLCATSQFAAAAAWEAECRTGSPYRGASTLIGTYRAAQQDQLGRANSSSPFSSYSGSPRGVDFRSKRHSSSTNGVSSPRTPTHGAGGHRIGIDPRLVVGSPLEIAWEVLQNSPGLAALMSLQPSTAKLRNLPVQEDEEQQDALAAEQAAAATAAASDSPTSLLGALAAAGREPDAPLSTEQLLQEQGLVRSCRGLPARVRDDLIKAARLAVTRRDSSGREQPGTGLLPFFWRVQSNLKWLLQQPATLKGQLLPGQIDFITEEQRAASFQKTVQQRMRLGELAVMLHSMLRMDAGGVGDGGGCPAAGVTAAGAGTGAVDAAAPVPAHATA